MAMAKPGRKASQRVSQEPVGAAPLPLRLGGAL